MGYWKLDKFTVDELNRVDQERFMDELFVLRHSPAACRVFAKAQYHLAVVDGASEEDALLLFSIASELFEAVSEFAYDVARHHKLAYSRWNPNRLWVPGVGKFLRLAEALGNEIEHDKYGEAYIRTICGWWIV